MRFRVDFSQAAEDDLDRLSDHLLDRAETLDDLQDAETAMIGLRGAVIGHLGKLPYSYRKAGPRSTRRELIVPEGKTGYVALYEITGPSSVLVVAVRHQLEEDYH